MFPGVSLQCIFFLGFAQKLLGHKMKEHFKDIHSRAQEDLRICSPWDSCSIERLDDSPGIKHPYTCSCHSQCYKFGTCCVDSPYRMHSPTTQKCSSMNLVYVPDSDGSAYFMVDKCPDSTENNSVWKDLCEEEWDEEDDIVKLAPVTSLSTYTTYINYYCLRCHEETYDIQFWNLNLTGSYTGSKKLPNVRDLTVTYSEISRSWVATYNNKDISFPINVAFSVPEKMLVSPIRCDPFVISQCSDRIADRKARDQCDSYAAIVYGKYEDKYKNVHCALCNDESFNDIACNRTTKGGYGGYGGGGYELNFKHVMEVNPSGGNKVGNIRSCREDEFWNPYLKKCKKIRCAIDGYVPKNGKCAAP